MHWRRLRLRHDWAPTAALLQQPWAGGEGNQADSALAVNATHHGSQSCARTQIECWLRHQPARKAAAGAANTESGASSMADRMKESTYSDLSSVDLDLPEGLLVGLGYAATSPDSPLDFRQAQSPAERSGVASPLNVADKCKGCPRGLQAFNRNSVPYALQPPGRHLANRHHLNTGRPTDCLWAAIRPAAPCLAKRGCKKGSQEQPYGAGLPAPRG